MDTPVDGKIVDTLYAMFKDFRRAYDPDGMKVEEFDQYGATRRTLRQFCKAPDDVVLLMRDFMIPNPDACGTGSDTARSGSRPSAIFTAGAPTVCTSSPSRRAPPAEPAGRTHN